jgi:hypothetical protein
MRSPLFVTLTMRNSDDLSLRGVRELKRAFGKFRHRNLWKSKVRGGIAAVEITNIGNGWHPHLHAVVDCRWLSNGTPAIHWRDQPARCAEKCRLSAEEVQKVWSKCIGQETSSVDIMRANRATISKEVLKYTIKNEDLVMCEGKIGDVIRALDGSRLLTTFGQCHGQCVKEIRREAKEQAKAAREKATPSDPSADCCPSPEFWPDAGFSLSYFEKTRDPATRTYTKMPRCESLPLTA